MNEKLQKSVVCLMWFGDKVMLARRKKAKLWQNHWAAIGGKVEKDETLMEAMIREIHEESDFYVYYPKLLIRDCLIYPEKGEQVFIFETGIFPHDFSKIKNTEPHKRTNWQLFSKKEALALNLVPRLAPLIKTSDTDYLKRFW